MQIVLFDSAPSQLCIEFVQWLGDAQNRWDDTKAAVLSIGKRNSVKLGMFKFALIQLPLPK